VRVVWTRAALGDLEEILLFLRREYPTAYGGFSARLHLLERRIALWPEGAAVVAGRPGVRVVPMIRYPYRLFYRATPEGAEVPHLRHAARRDP
jgi:plasmid stabilization system protein ParE